MGIAHAASCEETYAGLLPAPMFAAMTDAARRVAMWRDLIARGACIRVAVLEGRVVGLGCAAPGRDARLGMAAELTSLYVLREAQGRGLGRALLCSLAAAQRAEGRTSLGLWVLAANDAARGFYARLGGREGPPQREEGVPHIPVTWADTAVLPG